MSERPLLALMLTEAPSADVRGAAARRLLSAARAADRSVTPVFFYGDAVATPLAPDSSAAWRRLADRWALRLAVCPAALERRGLDLSDEAPPFEILGLPAWLDLALDAERIIRL